MGFSDFDIKMGDYSRYKLSGAIMNILTEMARMDEESKRYKIIDAINDKTIKAGYGYYEYQNNGTVRWKDKHIRHRKMNITVFVREIDGGHEIVVREGANRQKNVAQHKCMDREHASDFVDMYKDIYKTDVVDYEVDLFDDEPFSIEELRSIMKSAIEDL